MKPKKELTTPRQKVTDYLHTAALSSFALAQPLYDLLGRYADFFVAHGAPPRAILWLVVVFSLLVPVVLILAELLTELVFSEKVRRWVHSGFLGILFGFIVLPPLNRWGVLPSVVVYILGLLFGGLFVSFYLKWKTTRSFLTALSPAIVIFPAYFLFFTPVHSIVFPEKAPLLPHVSIGNKAPMTLIVFDEFNTMALLNKEGRIDSIRYPNFAALASESWWFPNAISSSVETTKSIPAILTGINPSPAHPRLATYADHPKNLFTLLARNYYLNLHESETSLYPDTLGRYAKVFESDAFVSDVERIWQEIFFPVQGKNTSTTLQGRWKGFKVVPAHTNKEITTGILFRKKQIEGFIGGIRTDTLNQLNFLHIALPHVPYEYLSTGKSYNNTAILPDGLISDDVVWGAPAALAEVAYQRYLQQVGYTDQVLGKILEALKKKGIYDESLIVVTADHGVSMQPGKNRRNYDEANRHDLIKVPLFFKLPNQKTAEVSRNLVKGVDILPTIADVLEATLPWEHDGDPMIPGMKRNKHAAREENADAPEMRTFNFQEIDGFPLLGWQSSVFGSGTPLTKLVRKDSNQTLLGKEVGNIPTKLSKFTYAVEIENIDPFRKIDLKSGYLPALLRGHVISFPSSGRIHLAIALNGIIRATTTTAPWGDKNAFFTVLLPEAAFQQGMNELEIFHIEGKNTDGSQHLSRMPIANLRNITLRSGKGGGELLLVNGTREYPVQPYGSYGFLDSFFLNESTCYITGWAFDKNGQAPVLSVVLFSGKEMIASIQPGLKRPDLVSFLKTEKGLSSGFQFEIPLHALTGEKLRGFALTRNGTAFELIITDPAMVSLENFLKKVAKQTSVK
jgi:hypothetical protein